MHLNTRLRSFIVQAPKQCLSPSKYQNSISVPRTFPTVLTHAVDLTHLPQMNHYSVRRSTSHAACTWCSPIACHVLYQTNPQPTCYMHCVCLLQAFSSDSSEQSGLSSHIQVSGTHSPRKARHVNSSGLHTFSSASNTTQYNLTYTKSNSFHPTC